MLSDRYRIIDLLGRGGMGEVYRAEDIKLSQPVALKFLPEKIANDAEWLSRLYKEVSIARQVSHRNVCRVYDVGEYAGQHFISMEFIRGEELGFLLKRIGRLPQEKAVETARQLCAGLAAIHDKGVLHRDLKPSNVMLDERGDVRITDFGLATGAEAYTAEADSISGTPAYMSPEQLDGKELTVRSDIYSLGLVLYEVFTGKRAFDAPSLAELLRKRKTDHLPITPSSLIRDLDPLVERTILRCLENDPAQRPATALQVAAMLPGGDPMAAALAMGETPSPEMVAAAPKEGTLRPAIAMACLAAVVVLGATAALVATRAKINNYVPLEKSTEVLTERASQLTRRFGYLEAPRDSAGGWLYSEFIRHIRQNEESPERWEQLRTGQPAGMFFWYRESPRYLLPRDQFNTRVRPTDPKMQISGMTRIMLDPSGRLFYFEAVPPQFEEADVTESPPTDWSVLFSEAGFDIANFKATDSRWAPPSMADARAAWEGVYPLRPDIPIRVETASFRGKPVYFEIMEPWKVPGRMREANATFADIASFVVFLSLVLGVLVVGGYLAWRNSRRGLGDRRGAFRLAAFAVLVMLAIWAVRASHVPSRDEFQLLAMALMEIALLAAMVWLFYMSFEPFIRRWWPHRVISWNRLLAGNFRDPLVGRDVLIGTLLAPIIPIIHFSLPLLSRELGLRPDSPQTFVTGTLVSVPVGLSEWAYDHVIFNLFFSLGYVFLFLVFYIVLKREFLASAALWLLLAVSMTARFDNHMALNIAEGVIIATVIVYVLNRFGLLVFITVQLILEVFIAFPFTTDLSAWYFDATLVAIVLLAVPAIYGFYVSLGDQKLFEGKLIPE